MAAHSTHPRLATAIRWGLWLYAGSVGAVIATMNANNVAFLVFVKINSHRNAPIIAT
jgi:hypothetical protein